MTALVHTETTSELSVIANRIAAQFEVTMGDPVVVETLCGELLRNIDHPPQPADALVCEELAACLRLRTGPLALMLFSALETLVETSDSPWPLLENMLHSREEALLARTLRIILQCIQAGRLPDTSRVLDALAQRCDGPEGADRQADVTAIIREIFEYLPLTGSGKCAAPAEYWYRYAEHEPVRRLAARVLDLDQQLPSPDLGAALLGDDNHASLAPYLDYTRATHLDVLRLARSLQEGSSIVTDLHAAEAVCGPTLVRNVLAELGWSRLSHGLSVRRWVGVRVAGSLPLMLSPQEVALFKACGDVQCNSEAFLVVTHGQVESGSSVSGIGGSERVERYRAYNLLHAELLDLILRVEPLTRDRVFQILTRMDSVVENFHVLFASASAECAILREVYTALKEKILAELSEDEDRPQLSPELTRLVQMFEEPRSLGMVRTLHGLKRYLHQQGLRLSFGLIETGRQLSRTVDVVTITPDGTILRGQPIRYADFEPEDNARIANGTLPYAAAVVAEGFGRQMLYGQTSFPSVDVFCYGNEVHYYLAYRNHPAFLRIDYAPPLRGGMIDLEYYGVSNYELGVHPNLALDAVQRFLQELGFDVELSGTRIHARCDKESITDLGTLCEKVEALFRLVPHLMDIDWTIGSLNLSAEARRQVADAWAESFALWGVLPIHQLLTANREGILEAEVVDSSGVREVAWSGVGEYRDLYSGSPPTGFFEQLSAKLEALELETLPLHFEDNRRPMGQVRLEERLFAPLRAAVQRAELVADERGFHRLPPELFVREHEAERFAEITAAGLDMVTQAVIIARIITPLERTLRFSTTGSVNGCEVQRTYLPLRGGRIGLYVLRDPRGAIRMAFYAPEGLLYRRRTRESDPWSWNWSCDVQELSSELRRNSYFVTGPELSFTLARQEAADLLAEIRTGRPRNRLAPLAEEQVVHGLAASPGRVTGPVMFGTEGRSPEDLDGAVLLAEVLRPDDNAYLYHCAGVMTTGGGVLSHAGLMAVQFSKPAMIIPGRWQRERDGSQSLLFMVEEFSDEVSERQEMQISIRRHMHEREHVLREGDLVVLDATRATLNVLGHDRDVVSLYEELRQLGDVIRSLDTEKSDVHRLRLRGQKMRARYLVEKILSRLTDAVIERYAAHELLLGAFSTASPLDFTESAVLVSVLMRNPQVGADARSYAAWLTDELSRQLETSKLKADARIPISPSPYEILARRLEVLRNEAGLTNLATALQACDITVSRPDPAWRSHVTALAISRLETLRHELEIQISQDSAAESTDNRLALRRRQLARIKGLLAMPADDGNPQDVGSQAARHALAAGRRSPRVLTSRECNWDCSDLIGWKAVNLAEIESVFGSDIVPPWFVITDHAFRELLSTPLAQLNAGHNGTTDINTTLRDAIAEVLARADLSLAAKSQLIRILWDGLTLPTSLTNEILEEYRRLGHASETETGELYVALRSSSREEDAEIAARAGEFETFLFVRGEHPLLEHLKRTWGSLWTERALHNRGVMGIGSDAPGGGVIVQKIVRSRVSGVVLTVNVAGGEPGEMVINAGYGLGEGVVSGRVAADQVTVSKYTTPSSAPLRFKYVISDKRWQVVFNERSGAGTIMTTTLYHQRLRPALEYVELLELVSAARRFEDVYGYPLDIEFAVEGTKLWILQVRPVATFATVVRETVEKFSLAM